MNGINIAHRKKRKRRSSRDPQGPFG